MATAKTGSFYLTETVELAAAAADGNRVQGTVDLGAYVNVPTGQAIAIDSVDFIYQGGTNYAGSVDGFIAGNGALTVQLMDLNPNTGSLNIDQSNNIASHVSDLYPDNFGPTALSEAFMVVNDSLYLVGGVDGAAVGGAAVAITARIRCRVVKLGTKDWMALAISSVASDN